MYKIIFITILATLLSAQNPKPYSSLGNAIYDNVEYIIILRDMKINQVYIQGIDTYINDVSKAKKYGYELELGQSDISKKEYLKKLRELSKKNSYFLQNINNYYKTVITKDDCSAFLNIIDSGLIDISKHKKEILNYYYKNYKDIDANEIIRTLLDEKDKSDIQNEKRKKHLKIKRTKEEAKIIRIRKEDKKRAKKLEMKLQKELEQKKLQIREEQKRELCD